MVKNKLKIIFKIIIIVLVLIALVFTAITVIKRLQYIRYPELSQKALVLLDKNNISHDKEIVLDFCEANISNDKNNEICYGSYIDEETGITIYEKIQKTTEGLLIEKTYGIEGTNIFVKVSSLTDAKGFAHFNIPSDKEILEKLKENIKEG